MTPFVIVEGTEAAFRAEVRRLVDQGWTVVEGWEARAPAGGERVARTGVVATPEDGMAAVLAAVRGAAVVVHGQADREVLDRLADDLRRLGHLEHRVGEAEPGPVGRLTPDQRALLDLLAEGLSVGEAAARLHLSRRTANRRLADARAVLSARTTTEAVVATRRPRLH